MSQSTGFFITLEGSEGTGKSTALKFIQDYLIQAKKEYIVTREPGGTPIAEQIRQVLLAPGMDEAMVPETELLLMFAGRVQHIQHVILPALKDRKWVICDRFVDASFAYQGSGRGIDESRIAWLENWLVPIRPDLTLLFDVPVSIGLERAKHRGTHDRIEQEKIDFFERVRVGYLNRMKQDTNRFRLIDATQSLEQVQIAIKKILDEI
ncbi:MAG: dTMP kinase [Gammaproteobacteria bacterium]|jgi:dTMP kinase|nr:dTMP kinase [Gammaproteobacteria bacterium]MCE3238907.1 dTMP kinase [Gammaproteobacteria bacterium]